MAKVEEKSWKPDDVAVIGLACRFPGSASDEAKLWELLLERKSAHSKAPKERFNVDAFHQQGATHPDNLAADGAHFLEQDVSSFDAPFFGITAEEAKAMDPQARMLLETSYEALENAGLSVESVADTDTGCYVGCFTRDYHEMLIGDVESSPKYAATGTGLSLLSNRLSWYYDLKGPSMTLDTACSSSLVGLHLACQSLKTGESKMAMVCGANLLLAPSLGIWLSRLNMLSSEGLSRSFAEGVSGYGRGEGIATVILKPLADALRDGDTIRAVIKGTGVNQDGHTKGITVPSSQAQSALIQSTYRNAGLDFAETGYFEGHGTGTPLGDPLEHGAVEEVIRSSKRTTPLLIGSIKSNIGHLEGAAGLAGLIKCILMLEKGIIVPNIHFDKPNKKISFKQVDVPTTTMAWPAGLQRRASVNSFGYGGTNAHAIVEAFFTPSLQRREEDLLSALDDGGMGSPNCRLFVFTGHEPSAVQEVRNRYATYTKRAENTVDPNVRFDDLSYTLGSHRSKLDWAASHVASNFSELRGKLSNTEVKATHSSKEARVGFVFTGQGAQWPRMGLELMQYTVFRESIEASDHFLSQRPDCHWSVIEELQKHDSESHIKAPEFSQPLCTILQMAMVDLLKSWQVRPVAVVGHSSGEIAAAYCAGTITKQAAWQIAFYRGRECADLKTKAPELQGAMLAVGLGADGVKPYIDAIAPGHINVACINSPKSVTVSGDASEVRKLLSNLSADNVFARELQVENAYHSHHMKLVAEPYLRSIANVTSEKGEVSSGIKMLSSVTGRLVESSELTPEYWVQNLVSPVHFSDAVTTMLRSSGKSSRRQRKAESAVDFLLEIGPHAALRGPLSDILKKESLESVGYASMLLRGSDAVDSAMTAAGDLYCRGYPVDVATVNNFQHEPRVLVDLPAYPWNRSDKYWATSRLTQNFLHRAFPHHGLLGKRMIGSDGLYPAWRHFLSVQENPWIAEHVVHGAILYPGAGFLAMATEAALQVAEPGREVINIRLKDVRIVKALVIKEDEDHPEVITRFRRVESGDNDGWEFAISCSRALNEPEQHATGQIMLEYLPKEPYLSPASGLVHEARTGEYVNLVNAATDTMEQNEFYNASRSAGLDYGPDFQGVFEMLRGTDSCCWSVKVTDRSATMPNAFESKHLIHPTTLDAIMHSLFGAMNRGKQFTSAALPVAFDNVTISVKMPSDAGATLSGFTVTREVKEREIVADIYVSSGDWEQPLLQMEGLRCTELPSQEATPAISTPQSAPLGSVKYRPDITLLDEGGLMSYIKENCKSQLTTESQSSLYSERLRNAVAQVIDLAVFKAPTSSILQIGGFDQGLTDSLLSTLKAGACGQALTSNILILDTLEENVSQIQEKYDSESSTVSALQYDMAKSLSSQMRRGDNFDVLLVTMDPQLDEERRRAFLTEARRLLNPGGIFVVFDSLPNIKENPTPYSFSEVRDSPPSQVRAWESFTIEDPACEKAAVLSMQKMTSDPIGISSRPICILRPPGEAAVISNAVGALEDLLRAHDIEVVVCTWPPDIEDVRGKCVIALLEMERPFLCDLDAVDFDMLRLVALQSARLLWVCPSDDPHMAVATGWLRVLQNENVNKHYQYLALERRADGSAPDCALAIAKVAMAQTEEREFIERSGLLNIPRWSYDPEMTRTVADSVVSLERDTTLLGDIASGLPLRMLHAGDPEHAHFAPVALRMPDLAADQVEIELRFVVIVDHDVKDPGTATLHEASGTIKAVGSDVSLFPGDHVCLSFFGHLSTRVVAKESICQKVPAGVKMSEAACLPVTFATAVRALIDVARVKPRQNVLVQAGGTRIGRAVVLLATASDAIVYATARDAEEVKTLIGLGVPRQNIFIDGDSDIPAATKVLTDRKGWDVIVRTDKTASAACLLPGCIAPYGAVVDVYPSGFDRMRETTISLMGVGSLLPEDPVLMQKTVSHAVAYRQQLSTFVGSFDIFPSSAVTDALTRQRSQGANRGVMLSFHHEDKIQVSPGVKNTMQLHDEATYILAGGLGGIGRGLAKLLVDNGARNLVFLSRAGPESPAATSLTKSMAGLGVTVKTFACDISDEQSLTKALSECTRTMPPIRGAIQAAAVVRDAVFDNYTLEQWQANLRPKVQGSWNLHCHLPKDMDFFVMLSSIAGLMGHRSQAGYAAGNTFQDSLALCRQSQGLPAVAIDLAAMLDVGAIMEGTTAAKFSASEATWMTEAELHSIIKMCISGGIHEYATPPQVCTGIPSGGMVQLGQHEMPLHFQRPFFVALKHLGTTGVATIEPTAMVDKMTELLHQLAASNSLADAEICAAEILCARLAGLLQRAADSIDLKEGLHKYGIDSLMAVELRTWIGKKMEADVSLFDVLNAESIRELSSKIAKASKLVSRDVQ